MEGHTAHAAPRTSIDLTSLVSPFCPSLFYFPILTPAAAASAHFLPSLIDAPSVDDRHFFFFGSICVKKSICMHTIVLAPLHTQQTDRGHALIFPPCQTLDKGPGLAVVSLSSQQCPQGAKTCVALCPGISITFCCLFSLSPSFPPLLPSTPFPLLCCGPDTETHDA